MKITLAKSKEDIKKCFPVIVQLRTALKIDEFVRRIQKQQKTGYQLAFLTDKGSVISLAGFRFIENLFSSKFVYIEDFITNSQNRSKGYGSRIFDWVVNYAKKNGCKELHLDSGVQRFDAHRFYLRKRMSITCHHFGLIL
ncbi:GNAT family N-acetyltransferase [Candidatus Gottesmanbacteria bacterium]|nr:GNAT family N-acetyltransferase [Candidatus Gottesmanbacteria bacterium]